jgi:hypothetical protein
MQEVTNLAVSFAARAQAPPASHPANARALRRTPDALFAPQTESTLALVAGVSQVQSDAVFQALAHAELTEKPSLEVFAFRAQTAPFGNRAPPKVVLDRDGHVLPPREWDLMDSVFGEPLPFSLTITPFQSELAFDTFMRAAVVNLQNPTVRLHAIVVTRVNVAGAAGEMNLRLRKDEAETIVLGDGHGDVQVTVTAFAIAPEPVWELTYAVSDHPLTLVLRQVGAGKVTATSRSDPGAEVALEITDTGSTLELRGTLRLVTGHQPSEAATTLCLDGTFDTLTPGGWVAFDAPPGLPAVPQPRRVTAANAVARTAYGQTARTTRLELDGDWIDSANATFGRAIRETSVYADSQPLTVLDEDLTADIGQRADAPSLAPSLELDTLCPGLASGRWLIVTGERTDLPGVTGAELVMLARAEHGGETEADGGLRPGETLHTRLTFAAPLAYSYVRASVRVLGNVVAASNGESCDEVLGSGDGGRANQVFTLKKKPLTYLPAATPSGCASTLRIWVNHVEWHEVESLATAGPDARVFTTTPSADGGVTVRFGDGTRGARLPSGAENVRARYRAGIGAAGNVAANAISTLLSRPLGVSPASSRPPRPASPASMARWSTSPSPAPRAPRSPRPRRSGPRSKRRWNSSATRCRRSSSPPAPSASR